MTSPSRTKPGCAVASDVSPILVRVGTGVRLGRARRPRTTVLSSRRPGSIAALLATVAVVFAITPACNALEQSAPAPVLVLESLGSKSEAVELVIVDLSGRELFRESTGATEALPSLHAASAQVAFWRRGASSSGT